VTSSNLGGNAAGGATGADLYIANAFDAQVAVLFDGVRTGQMFVGTFVEREGSRCEG
jgi:hypothetical protein